MNYFPFWIGDYLRDTADLSLAEHGAYLLLLLAYYSRREPLPNDPDSLRRIAKAFSDDEQRAVCAVAARFFYLCADGRLHHGRADEEIARTEKFLAKQAENGKRGGRPKAKQNPSLNPTVNPNETQAITQTVTQTKASIHHSPTPSKSKSKSPSAEVRNTKTRSNYGRGRQ